MSPLRLFALTVIGATLTLPPPAVAAPAGDASASACTAKGMTLAERRVSEEAAKGLRPLISFVNLTQPIYQLRVVDAVAWIDAERERRNQCINAAALSVSD